MEMGYSAERRALAMELIRLRRLEAECRRHQRRLPHQVQTALRLDAQVYDIDPTPAGMPGLFAERKSA